MVLEKIPTFREVKDWVNANTATSVNGETGDVTVEAVSDHANLDNVTSDQHHPPGYPTNVSNIQSHGGGGTTQTGSGVYLGGLIWKKSGNASASVSVDGGAESFGINSFTADHVDGTDHDSQLGYIPMFTFETGFSVSISGQGHGHYVIQ